MTVEISDRVADLGLDTLALCDGIYICSSQPRSFQEATQTYALGAKLALAGNLISYPFSIPGGRRVTLNAILSGVILSTGRATRWAAVDGASQTLLATGTLANSLSVRAGQRFSMPSWDITLLRGLSQPFVTSLSAISVNIGAPVLGTPQENPPPIALSAVELITGLPTIGLTFVKQISILLKSSFLDAVPLLGAPLMRQLHVLAPASFRDAVPVFAPAQFVQRQSGGAGSSLTSGVPSVGAPAIGAGPNPAVLPFITAVSPSVPTNPGLDTLITHLTITNLPLTSIQIVGGDPSGYFIAYPGTQNLRTSETVGPIPDSTYNLQIQASNAAGTGPIVNITLTVGAGSVRSLVASSLALSPPQLPALGLNGKITAAGLTTGAATVGAPLALQAGQVYNDGLIGAPVGTPQFAGLLNGYRSRPPWKVAGVDYRVGVASSGVTMLNPSVQSNLPAGCTADAASHVVTITGNNTKLGSATQGFAFPTDWHVEIASTATGEVTVQNCTFNLTGASYVAINKPTSNQQCDLTVLNCEVNGNSATTSSFIDFASATQFSGGGTFKARYCYFHNLQIDAFQVGGNTTAYVDIQFCAVSGIGTCQGTNGTGHPDMVQFIEGTIAEAIVAFSLFHMPPNYLADGNPMLDCEAQFSGIPTDVTFCNNCLVSLGPGTTNNSLITGFFIDDTTSQLRGYTFAYNFIDETGSTFGTFGTPWQMAYTSGYYGVIEGNIRMTDGVALTQSQVQQVPAGSVAQGVGVVNVAPSTDIASITASPATGTLAVGGSVSFTVNYNRRAVITGSIPYLQLSNGARATYATGSGTKALTFSYTVAASDASATNLAISSFVGGIRDQFGNVMTSVAKTFTGLNVSVSVSSIALTKTNLTDAVPTLGAPAFTMTTPYPDGLIGAPVGSAQYPAALNAFGGVTGRVKGLIGGKQYQPPWNVAGVDYYVGVDSSAVLVDPAITTNLPAGCVYSGRTVFINTDGVVLQNLDCTLHSGICIKVNANNVTIQNCRIRHSAQQPQPSISCTTGKTGLQISMCEVDDGGFQDALGRGLMLDLPVAGVVLRYNWFRNAAVDFIEADGNGTSCRYCLFDTDGIVNQSAADLLKTTAAGATDNIDIQFNFVHRVQSTGFSIAASQPGSLATEGLIVAVPILGAPALVSGAARSLTASALTAGVPALGAPAIGTRSLASASFTNAAPTLGAPALGHRSLANISFTDTAPTLGAPALAQQAPSSVYPGLAGNPVGYAATPASAPASFATVHGQTWPGAYTSLTAWPDGVGSHNITDGTHATSGSGTSGDPYIFAGYDFSGGANATTATISLSNCIFVGCRFQSNSTDNYNSSVTGANVTFLYCSFTPLASYYTSPPGTAWPSAGAGANTDVRVTDTNCADSTKAYAVGVSVRAASSSVLVEHCDFWGWGEAIDLDTAGTGGCIIRDCWLHDAHSSGGGAIVYGLGGAAPANVTIDHCAIASIDPVSTILSLQGATTPYNNITITNNYFTGGTYSLNLFDTTVGSHNITFTDNVVGADIQVVYNIVANDVYDKFLTSNGLSNVWRRNKWHVPTGATKSATSNFTVSTADDNKFLIPQNDPYDVVMLSTSDWAL
jgi:hypothetical protein